MQRLLSDKLVKLIEKNTLKIIKKWSESLLADKATSGFSKEHMDYVIDKAKILLKDLGTWISYDTKKEKIEKRYSEEAIEFFSMGIPLCEAIRATVVLRRFAWLFVVSESASDSAFEMHQMRELNDRLVLFFDRAQYYMIREYMDEVERQTKKLSSITDKDIGKIFFSHTFYNK